MQNPGDVTTKAFDGLVGEISIELGITDKRVYEMLGRDNYYPKLWRLLNPLGRIAPERLHLVRADFNSRCDRILTKHSEPTNPAQTFKEVSEAMYLILAGSPAAERRTAILEAIAELQKQLDLCD